MEFCDEELSPIPCTGPYYVGTEGTCEPKSLFLHLLRARKARAKEIGCAPYEVATTEDLLKLKYARPVNLSYLARISGVVGFSKSGIINDGNFWLSLILKFCSENGLEPNQPIYPSRKRRTLPAWMVHHEPRKLPVKSHQGKARAEVIHMMKSNSLFKL